MEVPGIDDRRFAEGPGVLHSGLQSVAVSLGSFCAAWQPWHELGLRFPVAFPWLPQAPMPVDPEDAETVDGKSYAA